MKWGLNVSNDQVVDEIRALEEKLLSDSARKDEIFLEQVFAKDCVEFGASGKVYKRSEIIKSLLATKNSSQKARIVDFTARSLGQDHVMATYRINAQNSSIRSSIWRRDQKNWQLMFHQGTHTE